MSIIKYPHLFSPIKIGNVTYKNRIFAAPTGYLNTPGNHLPQESQYYYARKAMGGAAAVATCEWFVDILGRSFDKQMCLDTPNIDMDLARIAHAIDANGAVPIMELQHAGMYGTRDITNSAAQVESGLYDEAKNQDDVAFGPVDCIVQGRRIKGMDEDMIQHTIDKFIEGAALGQRMGYRGVFVHAGHGWCLHQFLSPLTNTRTDEWGGSAENRCRIVNAIVDGIHKRCGAGFPVEVRISGTELYDEGYGFDIGLENAIQIGKHADMIQVSSGNHEVQEVFTKMCPDMFCNEGFEIQYAAEVKKNVDCLVSAIGGFSDPDIMEEVIATGKADVIAIARELMCEPDFPNLVRAGRASDAKRCVRCLYCFANEMSNGEPYCALNPESGRDMEAYFGAPNPVRAKKVLVVGGGVGGMEAALQCAKRGHDVVLCEKENRLGGVMRCEEAVDFKKNFAFYLDLQERKCMRDPHIDVRLGTEVTPEYAASVGADVIVAALGSAERKPAIEGIDLPNVMSGIEAYAKIRDIGEKVVVIGGGLVGVEQALYLKSLGKEPVVVARHNLRSDNNHLHALAIRVEIARQNLEVHENTGVVRIEADRVVCTNPDGSELILPADTVIYATGMDPRFDEAMALAAAAPEFWPIGDCMVPRNMSDAISQAYMTARNIGLI